MAEPTNDERELARHLFNAVRQAAPLSQESLAALDAIAAQLASARSSAREWIAVSERMPEGKARKLLVVFRDRSHGVLSWSPVYSMTSEVTHWAEYPELPPLPEGDPP